MIERSAHRLNVNRIQFLLLAGWVLVGARAPVYGQILHATGPVPSYEVATIKPSPPSTVDGRRIGPKGADRFLAQNATVKDLIEFAYTIDSNDQLIGVSGWMNSVRYDIDAKVGDTEVAAVSQLVPLRRMDPYRFMVQSLLADRFKLKVHFETRMLPIYELVVAKGGPKLKASEMNPANPAETVKPRSLRIAGAGNAVGSGVTTGMLAEILENLGELGGGAGSRGRMVVDKTNLTGQYDWTLHWTPESPDSRLQTGVPADPNGPSLFTALQEQLGLRLESAKGPGEVLIIDHIEVPSEN